MTWRITTRTVGLSLLGFVLQSTVALAQPLGTFRWQLQPFCNVLTINVTQSSGVYTLDGFDDLCGSVTKATVVGIAFPKSDGTLGMGLTLVLPGGAAPLHITTSILPRRPPAHGRTAEATRARFFSILRSRPVRRGLSPPRCSCRDCLRATTPSSMSPRR